MDFYSPDLTRQASRKPQNTLVERVLGSYLCTGISAFGFDSSCPGDTVVIVLLFEYRCTVFCCPMGGSYIELPTETSAKSWLVA
jgi:hypothetical protein